MQCQNKKNYDFIFASCKAGDDFAKEIKKEIDNRLRYNRKKYVFMENIDWRFSDKEVCVEITESPKNKNVFIVQSIQNHICWGSVDESLMALLVAARTFKEYGAKKITAIIPYLAYTRQDKTSKGKMQPTTAKLISDLLKCSGIDSIITWHIGTEAIKDLYSEIEFYSIDPILIYSNELNKYRCSNNTILISPDDGAISMCKKLSDELNIEIGYCKKKRINDNNVEIISISIGERKFNNIIIFDNLVASGGTIKEIIKKIDQSLKIEKIIICISHIYSNEENIREIENICKNYRYAEIITTNSISNGEYFNESKFIKIKSIADEFAKQILKTLNKNI